MANEIPMHGKVLRFSPCRSDSGRHHLLLSPEIAISSKHVLGREAGEQPTGSWGALVPFEI